MITFQLLETTGKSYDCECCGCYSSSGEYIYVNDKMVWERFNDGHMYGHQTEEPLFISVIQGWNEAEIEQINANYTEEARAKWNKKHPGNAIAATPVDWLEQKQQMLKYQEMAVTEVMKNCGNLPYSEILQIKMIALWIESETGNQITITTKQAYKD